MVQKMKKETRVLKLFRYASIAMSLLSCFTTYQGFRNTVFASEKSGLTAGIASVAVQTVLLAGVLKYFPMRDVLLKKRDGEIQRQEADPKQLKAIEIKYNAQLSIIKAIIGFALATSVLFSYISIVNNMYIDDFAVNANIKLEEFMKSSIHQMEKDNDAYVTQLREEVVGQLKKNGQEMIEQSVAERARDYAIATAQITPVRGRKCLIDLNTENGGLEKQSSEPLKLGGEKVRIRRVTDQYAEAEYGKLMEKNPKLKKTKFAHGLKTKINNLNENIYIVYCNYYNQYYFAVNRYNAWHKKMRKGSPPSLEELKSLKSSCLSMEKGIDKLLETIEGIQDGHAKKNTKRLIAEASDNVRPLLDAAKSLKVNTNKMINNSYGKDSKSFPEIISAFGSTAVKKKELKAAQEQMLEMQGILLKNVSSSAIAFEESNEAGKATDISEVTQLMDNLERYVAAVQYNTKLQKLKGQIEKNYNIDNSAKKKKTGQGVITVNSETWTRIKKVQMTRFTELIYNHPVNLYDSQNESEEPGETNRNIISVIRAKLFHTTPESGKSGKYQKLITKAYTYRKDYLDTSDSEKAYHLLLGGREYFQYKGKAVLSVFFAAFLDVGAFGIGYLMYRMEEKKQNAGLRKNKHVIFRNQNF